MMRLFRWLALVVWISPLHAGDLGKGMELEYGKRGLAAMKLGEGRKVSPAQRWVSASARARIANDAECLRRLRNAGVRVSPWQSGSSYRVDFREELTNLRYQGDGYWRADYRGVRFVLSDRAKIDHGQAWRNGRAPSLQMSIANGRCVLRSARE